MCPGWNVKHICASRRTVRTELKFRADVRVVAKDLRRRESEGSLAYKGQSAEEDPIRKHTTDGHPYSRLYTATTPRNGTVLTIRVAESARG
jgi:hypothetical protein